MGLSQRSAAPADGRARGRPFPFSVPKSEWSAGRRQGLARPLAGACEAPGSAPDERGCDARSRGAASDPTGLRSPLNGRCASRRSTWPAIKDRPRKRPPKCGTTFVSSPTTRHDRAEHAELGINTQKSRSPAAALGDGKKKGRSREQPFHCQAVARLREAMICLTRMSR